MSLSAFLVVLIMLVGISSASAAAAPSAEETIEYINSKLGGKKIDYPAYALRYDGVKLEGSSFVLFKTVYQHRGHPFGDSENFWSNVIDLTKMAEFSSYELKNFLRPDRTLLTLHCDDSHGECVAENECVSVADGKCLETKVTSRSILYIDLTGLHPTDRERVKNGIVHLKSLFSLHKNKELFDK